MTRDQGATQPRPTGQEETRHASRRPGTADVRAAELLGEALTAALGPVDDLTGDAIAGICNDALHAVLGPAMTGAPLADRRLLPLAAPWVRDLARGLQYQSRHDGPEPRTASLLARLGGLKLGSRLYLVQELLRLLPPAGADGRR